MFRPVESSRNRYQLPTSAKVSSCRAISGLSMISPSSVLSRAEEHLLVVDDAVLHMESTRATAEDAQLAAFHAERATELVDGHAGLQQFVDVRPIAQIHPGLVG